MMENRTHGTLGHFAARLGVVALFLVTLNACQQGLPYDDPVQNGQWLAKKDCGNCHGPEDTGKGPSLLGIQGTMATLDDGTQVLRDQDYFRRSVTDPWPEVVDGWGKTMLPSRYNEEELAVLVAWMMAGSPAE